MELRYKNSDGTFSAISKGAALAVSLLTITGMVFAGGTYLDDRYAHTIEVAGQFKQIQEAQQSNNIQQELAINEIRIDVLEGRLVREQGKPTPNAEQVIRLQSAIRRLETRQQTLEQMLLQ